jgi:hypothetical protein
VILCPEGGGEGGVLPAHATEVDVSDIRDEIPQCLIRRLFHNTIATASEDHLADHGAIYRLDSLKSALN